LSTSKKIWLNSINGWQVEAAGIVRKGGRL